MTNFKFDVIYSPQASLYITKFETPTHTQTILQFRSLICPNYHLNGFLLILFSQNGFSLKIKFPTREAFCFDEFRRTDGIGPVGASFFEPPAKNERFGWLFSSVCLFLVLAFQASVIVVRRMLF